MDIDMPLIIVGLLFSGVGFVYFRYGKKQANVQLIATGVGLMAYAYLTPTVTWSLIVGGTLTALPFVFRWW